MDKKLLFKNLEKEKSDTLFKFIKSAYELMNTEQKNEVFGQYYIKIPPEPVTGNELYKKIKIFYDESINGNYYEPFDTDSNNFSNVPEETEVWCEMISDYFDASSQLTTQKDHEIAVKCFKLLNSLIESLSEEIVFADELGTWMITGYNEKNNKAYLTSLVKIKDADEFANKVIPLIEEDSYISFTNKIYCNALEIANKNQKEKLISEVKRLEIRVG